MDASRATPSSDRMSPPIVIGVVVASIALLALEVAELRIFSYSIDPLLVFSAISVALLGLGAGGIVVALRPELAKGDVRARLVVSLAGFAVSILVCHAIFARTSGGVGFGTSEGILRAALPLFSLFIIPYLFGGVFLSIAMTRWIHDIGRVYLVNLVGSAAGCVVIYPLLRPFGVEAVVAGIAAVVALSSVWIAWDLPGRARPVSLAIAAACLASIFVAPRLFPFQPDPGDLYGVARAALRKHEPGTPERDYEPVREFSRWDPVSRIEVYAFPGKYGKLNDAVPIRFFAQDGGAGSTLFNFAGQDELARGLFEGTVYGSAYLMHPAPKRALAIGLGGGPDIQAALHHRAGHITGVEINETTIDIVKNEYASFTGHPYTQTNVQIIHRDGRSFLERSTERYDVIQMSGTDTYSAGASGAFMFSESYLYTIEAFRRYYGALSDDGVLSIIRFGLEPLRVVSTELAALRSLGVERPEDHFVVLGQGIMVNAILFRRPVAKEEGPRIAKAVEELNARSARIRIPVYDVMGFGFSDPMTVLYAPGLARTNNPYADMLLAASKGAEGPFIAGMPLDFTPVDDDRPFFFQFLGVRHLKELFGASKDADYHVRGFRAHLVFLGAIALFAVGLILAPIAVLRRGGVTQRSALASLGYFGALGFAYLFVELTLMQKSALFLGHPTYSIAVTLVTLLLASGLGSAWSSRRKESGVRVVRAAALAIVVLLGLEHLGMHALFVALLPTPFAVRVVALVLAMFPLGFVMGMPFPIGLRATAAQGGAVVAWALGINGFASVVASLLAVPLAMFWGFSAVLGVAVALYSLAALLVPGEAPASELAR